MRSLSKKIYARRRRKEKRAPPPPPPPPPPRRSASLVIGGGGGYRCLSSLCFNPNLNSDSDSPLITPNPSGGDPMVTKKPSSYHEFVRALLESNDFYSRDCNVHRDITFEFNCWTGQFNVMIWYERRFYQDLSRGSHMKSYNDLIRTRVDAIRIYVASKMTVRLNTVTLVVVIISPASASTAVDSLQIPHSSYRIRDITSETDEA